MEKVGAQGRKRKATHLVSDLDELFGSAKRPQPIVVGAAPLKRDRTSVVKQGNKEGKSRKPELTQPPPRAPPTPLNAAAQPYYAPLPAGLVPSIKSDASGKPRPPPLTSVADWAMSVLRVGNESQASSQVAGKLRNKGIRLENVHLQVAAQRSDARRERELARSFRALSNRAVKKRRLVGAWRRGPSAPAGRAEAGNLGATAANANGDSISTQERAKNKRETRPSYETALALHDLWNRYIARVAAAPVRSAAASPLQGGPTSFLRRLASADLTGAFLRVSESSASGYVGLSGVVLRETAETVEILTPPPRCRCRQIFKRACTFELAANGNVCVLRGKQRVLGLKPSKRRGSPSVRDVSSDFFFDAAAAPASSSAAAAAAV